MESLRERSEFFHKKRKFQDTFFVDMMEYTMVGFPIFWTSCIKLHHVYGMLRHSLGGAVFVLSLQHFISPPLNFMPCGCVLIVVYCLLALPTKEGGNEGNKWFEGRISHQLHKINFNFKVLFLELLLTQSYSKTPITIDYSLYGQRNKNRLYMSPNGHIKLFWYFI